MIVSCGLSFYNNNFMCELAKGNIRVPMTLFAKRTLDTK